MAFTLSESTPKPGGGLCSPHLLRLVYAGGTFENANSSNDLTIRAAMLKPHGTPSDGWGRWADPLLSSSAESSENGFGRSSDGGIAPWKRPTRR